MNLESLYFLYYGYGFWLGRTFRIFMGVLAFPWWIWGIGMLRARGVLLKMVFFALAWLNFLGFLYDIGMWFWTDALGVVGIITKNPNFSSLNIPDPCNKIDDVLARFSIISWSLNVVLWLGFELWKRRRQRTRLFWRKCFIVIMASIIGVGVGIDLLYNWNRVLQYSPMEIGICLSQPIQPGCPTTYFDFILAAWQVWLTSTASLLLGVYLAPRQWLRHLWRRRWDTARRLILLAMVQGVAALYLLLPLPLTLIYRFISRVTCDPRFLVPLEPWRSVFAMLNGEVFGVAISMLGLLVLQCYDEGRCRLGVEIAFSRLRPGAGRERVQQSQWGGWLYRMRRWVVQPLLLGVGLWNGWQIGYTMLSALWAWLR